MADGLPTGKTWLRGGESLPSPSCTQPCKSRSVRKISCHLDGDIASIVYSRKVCCAAVPLCLHHLAKHRHAAMFALSSGCVCEVTLARLP